MSGFDDRRNDPTVMGQPGAAHRQQPYGTEQSGPEGDNGGQTPAPNFQWQPVPGAQQPLNPQWDAGASQQPPANHQWQPAGPPQPEPTVQWQPSPGGQAQPEPTLQWQPSPIGQAPGPTPQWQPSSSGQSSPNQWTPGGAAQFEPTLLRQPAPDARAAQNQQWDSSSAEELSPNQHSAPSPFGSAQFEPIPQGHPAPSGQIPETQRWGSEPSEQTPPNQPWQATGAPQPEPSFPWQPAPSGHAPQNQQWDSSASGQTPPNQQWSAGSQQQDPTLQWQPSPTGQPEPTLQQQPNPSGPAQSEPTLQWQPAPAQPVQYGEVSPVGQFSANQYGVSQPAYGGYGRPPGFGGQPGQQFPHGRGPNGRAGGGHGKAWLAAAVAAIVVAGGATAAVVVADRGSDDTRAQDTSPSMVSALTTTAGAHPSSPKPSAAEPAPGGTGTRNEPPVVPGYQVVVAPDRGAAYDVPADWTVASEGTIGGFGEPPNAVVGKGYASEGKSYCPGSTRTVSFLTGSKESDLASAATEVGTKTAQVAYHGAPGAPGGGQPLSSLDGGQQGMFVETKGSIPQAKPGCATEYSVYTFAAPTESGSFVMVIAADTGIPKAVDAPTAMQIFASVRAHEG
ncbi:hypothetical protein ACLMAJ_14530 [Nocardia sp. KC 131]|uniref:hypothetical protein n=1 Tax=Nocardia arseniciresistens TaxID=3392119 RepID=UPI00398EBCBE